MKRLHDLVSLARACSEPRRFNRRKKESQQQANYKALELRQLLATIVWTTGDISGNSDVSTNGTSVFAINGSDSTGPITTVNGVEFVASIRANAASESQAQSPGNESLTTTINNDNGGSFTNGGINGAMGSLINGAWWGASSGNLATATLSGLTVGDEYEVQIFSSDGRSNRHDGYVTRLNNGAGGTGVDLQLNNQPSGNRAGDFGTGTFTADSSTQTIELSGFVDGAVSEGRIQINAIQLRKLDSVILLPGAHPLINEFSASNNSVLDDDNGNSSDWIEIFNAGEDSLDLAGYSLTDNSTNTTKFVFPSQPLEGGQYLVVFAGDDEAPATGTDLYTGFALSAGGEYVGLYDPAGSLVTEFAVGGGDYPAQYTDVSYGFEADDTYSVPSFFATPTPGSRNVNPVDGVIEEVPTVSVERGFYDVAFDVNVTSQSPGATLVYTTDGTEPSLTNGIQVNPANANSLAQFGLTISETTSLRTAAAKEGFLTRSTTTHTYVFLDDVISSDVMDTDITQDPQYASLMRDSLLDIPTLSFNYENVIVNSDLPEQRASIEWLAPDGSEGFQIDAGIKGFGGYFTDFAKKNFRVNFRSQYGASKLDFPLFEGFDNGIAVATEDFDSLDFRSGSHDMVQRGFYMSNRFVDDTLMDAGHVVPHGRFVHIYTNGVYWGQYHMRERWDADFLSQYYGGDDDDYEAVNGNVNNGNSTPDGWSPGDVYDGEGTAWSNIKLLADTDGSGNPTGGYQELKEAVNLEQYIDYMLVYMAGSSENEYRAGGSSNGVVPYTFTLNDADGWLRGTGDRTDNAGPGNILGTLVDEADPEFMTLYADRIHHMFGEDGVLSPDRSVERLQNRLDEIELSFISESARWGYRTPDSWASAADSAIQNMLPNIADEMLDNFRARGLYPNFDAPEYLVDGVSQSGGEVIQNALLTFSATGLIYYTVDGSDPRLTGGGINPDALVYDPGSSDLTIFGSGSTWKYEDSGANLGTAWRSSSFNDGGWSSGASELGYGDGDEATVVSFGSDPDDKYITTYFRKTFNVATGDFDAAELLLKRDDGAVVYLNGTEIVRSNMPAGTIDFETVASGAIGGVSEDAWNVFSIDPALLQTGSNTLAIEIHQANATSSDVTFDAELIVTTQNSSSSPYVLGSSTNVRSRTISGGLWSALHDATFVIPAAQSEIRISEIHYNPADPTADEIAAGYDDNDNFEFIEVYNPNPVGSINLAGMQLSDGVTFSFSDVELLPGERAVVVEDADAFLHRYGNSVWVLGEWNGGLDNSGERVDLIDSTFAEIMSVNYGDNDPWHAPADGHGFSIVLDQPHSTSVAALGKYYSWRTSTEFGGTPGEASAQPLGVVVNEVLAHTDAPQSDSIELFNPTSTAIDVGGWYLSDDGDSLLKFQIPTGTVIAAGGYAVFNEDDFNPNPSNPGPNDFALSSAGDQVFLSRANGENLLDLQDAVEFDATFNGDSLGRLPNGNGRLFRLAETSFGSANGAHAVSGLLISEINYHPDSPTAAAIAIDPTLTDYDLEFIEIANPTNAVIDLTNWRIRGESDYDFEAGTSIAAGGTIVVLAFDPADSMNATRLAAFLEHYGLDSADKLVGGLSGSLSNSFGRIALQQPDTPNDKVIPRVVVDEVVYDDLAPWADADGSGSSLNRIGPNEYANDPNSWEGLSPTPGSSILVRPSVTSVVIGDGLSQRSTIDKLVISFQGEVDIATDAISIIQLSDANGIKTCSVVDSSFTTETIAGNTIVTISFQSETRNSQGALVDGNYELTVYGGKVTRTGTQVTLGENYVLGDVASDNFFSLYGDFNGSRNVNIFDLLSFRQTYGLSVGDPGFNADLDYDGNGTINVFDLLRFRQNYGKTLPFDPV
ncbi:lamin tail domain-containing protein [Mariniblastus fucicola]|uniref:CotH protein n=1 Tax=Mariniblastus fucicola TaxID=980251 RepID=A0A5B9PJN2_9BACT|nr:lamin tail domain-containing protein [Mariniblastus fucicola]QEG24886.1 CotH protein [Mariniblastus fucicola]